MPDKVRIIQRKDKSFDGYIADLLELPRGHERTYAGIANGERAEEVRRRLRAAGRHHNVAVRAFWRPCDRPGRCPAGADCRFHVHYAVFDRDAARRYKARQASSHR